VSAEPAAGRRRFVLLLPLLAALPWASRRAVAAPATPAQMLGPFYPLQPDPAAGNDLTTVDGRGRAQGTPLTIVGRVLDTADRAPRPGFWSRSGRPMPTAATIIRTTTARRRATLTFVAMVVPSPAAAATIAFAR
jgi:hypothetical protein